MFGGRKRAWRNKAPRTGRVLVVFMLLLDSLRRIFGEVRAIDWIMLVVELLVLFLIAYEVLYNVLHQRKVRKALKVVVAAMTDGAFLQQKHQRAIDITNQDQVTVWANEVFLWTKKTEKNIHAYSEQAASSFAYVVSQSGGLRAELDQRIEVLRRIMENPDAYF